LAPCRKILRHAKEPFKAWKRYFARPNSSFSSPIPPPCHQMTLLVGLPESSGGRIRNFLYRNHFTIVLHAHISPGGWIIGQLVAVILKLLHGHRQMLSFMAFVKTDIMHAHRTRNNITRHVRGLWVMVSSSSHSTTLRIGHITIVNCGKLKSTVVG
jgi:hypothetical protein